MACNCSINNNNVSYLVTGMPCPKCYCSCSSSTQSCEYCRSSSCTSCDDTVSTANLVYSGPALLCINKPTATPLEEIIQSLDTKICTIEGADYTSYDFACLLNPDTSNISTQEEFVAAISNYVCNISTTNETFVTNYNTFVTNITNLVTEAGTPGITNTCTGIIPSDTNAEAFTKIGNTICNLQTAINPSGITWNVCGLTVGSAPTTVSAAFTTVLSYICQIKSLIPASVTLPTFNNVGTCLPGTLTTTDGLASTVNKLITKVCSLNYDVTAINYGCVDGATTLQDALQNTIDRVNEYVHYEFDNTYFTVADLNPSYPCNGQSVTLNLAGLDSKVASNGSDLTPGYLSDKLQAGANVTLDYITTPGKVIVSSTSTVDHKVSVNGSDASADYLDAKIDGAADADGFITLDATTNVGNSKVIVTPTIDYLAGANKLLTAIQSDTALFSIFQNMVCATSCAGNRTVQFTIEGADKSIQFSASQDAPTLAWYNTGATVISGLITSGTYPITTVATNPQATLSFQNNGSATYNLSIVVKDLFGVVVPSSSSVSTTVAAGAVLPIPTFNLGIGVPAYVVQINIT